MNRLNSTQLLDAIFDSAVDGIMVIDEKGIILSANPSVAKLFGYQQKELLGQSINMLMPSPDAAAHDSYILNYLKTGKAKIIGIGREVEGKRKDGSIFPFDLSISVIHLDDGRRLFAGTVHDISKQKEAQKEIQELNEKLEKRIEERTEQLAKVVNRLTQTNIALRNEIYERKLMEDMLRKSEQDAKIALEREKELSELKSRFITTASHEFRTPLSTIMSSAKLIGRYSEKEQQEKREKHINRIVKVVKNLNTILDDLLSWNKLEEGKSSYQPQLVDLQNLIQSVLEEAEIFSKDNQEIIYNYQGDLQAVMIDPNYLHNILLNLLSNAVKYSDEGSNIFINCRQSPDKIEIEVIDEGVGIPEEAQLHLFERFYRAENVHNIPGTGLGLNIVRKYLDSMNGQISFESQLGKGSCFKIEFPLK